MANKKELDDFLKKNNYNLPLGFDEKNELAYSFNVKAIPMTILVNKDKIIKNIIIGARSEDQYEKLIKGII